MNAGEPELEYIEALLPVSEKDERNEAVDRRHEAANRLASDCGYINLCGPAHKCPRAASLTSQPLYSEPLGESSHVMVDLK